MATGIRASARTSDANRPFSGATVVVPTDDPSKSIPTTRGLYLGTGGDLTVYLADNGIQPITVKNAPQGYNMLQVFQVLSTGTLATNILALY